MSSRKVKTSPVPLVQWGSRSGSTFSRPIRSFTATRKLWSRRTPLPNSGEWPLSKRGKRAKRAKRGKRGKRAKRPMRAQYLTRQMKNILQAREAARRAWCFHPEGSPGGGEEAPFSLGHCSTKCAVNGLAVVLQKEWSTSTKTDFSHRG